MLISAFAPESGREDRHRKPDSWRAIALRKYYGLEHSPRNNLFLANSSITYVEACYNQVKRFPEYKLLRLAFS